MRLEKYKVNIFYATIQKIVIEQETPNSITLTSGTRELKSGYFDTFESASGYLIRNYKKSILKNNNLVAKVNKTTKKLSENLIFIERLKPF